MDQDFSDFLSPEGLGVISVGFFVAAGAVIVLRSRRKKQLTAEQVEVRRREWLGHYGKLGGGEIVELQDDSISYSYDVRGINYTASQDISALRQRLPSNRWSIVGGVGVKYDPRNAANSIVLSETWTGLRRND